MAANIDQHMASTNTWQLFPCFVSSAWSPTDLVLLQVSPVGEENEVGPGANAEG